MNKEISIEDVMNELSRYATLSRNELGEACQALLSNVEYAGYLSDEFEKNLKREIREQHKYFKANYKIVKATETKTYEYETLELIRYG